MEARSEHERYENGNLPRDFEQALAVAALQGFLSEETEQ